MQKTGDMAVGAVSFYNDRLVKRFYIKERKNEIVNRLNKTKEERAVDFEAERQERERAAGRKKKEHALQQVRPSTDHRKKRRSKPSGTTRSRRPRRTTRTVRGARLTQCFLTKPLLRRSARSRGIPVSDPHKSRRQAKRKTLTERRCTRATTLSCSWGYSDANFDRQR